MRIAVDRTPALGTVRAGRMLRTATGLAIATSALLAGPDAAFATTDTTFDAPLDTVTDMVSGTGGQLAAALAVGAALVGSVLRFNAMQLMGAVGVGVAAGAGTGIVTGLVGTAIVLRARTWPIPPAMRSRAALTTPSGGCSGPWTRRPS